MGIVREDMISANKYDAAMNMSVGSSYSNKHMQENISGDNSSVTANQTKQQNVTQEQIDSYKAYNEGNFINDKGQNVKIHGNEMTVSGQDANGNSFVETFNRAGKGEDWGRVSKETTLQNGNTKTFDGIGLDGSPITLTAGTITEKGNEIRFKGTSKLGDTEGVINKETGEFRVDGRSGRLQQDDDTSIRTNLSTVKTGASQESEAIHMIGGHQIKGKFNATRGADGRYSGTLEGVDQTTGQWTTWKIDNAKLDKREHEGKGGQKDYWNLENGGSIVRVANEQGDSTNIYENAKTINAGFALNGENAYSQAVHQTGLGHYLTNPNYDQEQTKNSILTNGATMLNNISTKNNSSQFTMGHKGSLGASIEGFAQTQVGFGLFGNEAVAGVKVSAKAAYEGSTGKSWEEASATDIHRFMLTQIYTQAEKNLQSDKYRNSDGTIDMERYNQDTSKMFKEYEAIVKKEAKSNAEGVVVGVNNDDKPVALQEAEQQKKEEQKKTLTDNLDRARKYFENGE